MADYDAGRAFLQIVPSFKGVRDSIRGQAKQWADDVERAVARSLPEGFAEGAKAAQAEARKGGSKAGEDYGGAFAKTVRTRIEAALKALPKVKVDADSSLADIKLAAIRAELEDLGKQRIGVDVDDAVALAQLDRLRTELDELGANASNIQVRADTAAAAAEIDKLAEHVRRLSAATPTVQVDADTAAADAKLAATKAESDNLARSSPSIRPDVDTGRALVGIGVIRAALLALTAAPLVIPVAAAGASLLGPLTAAGVGTLGFGAVATPGLARMHTASQAQAAAGGGGGAGANSTRLAQLALADAQRQVAITARESARAQAQAAEQVRQAEQNLAAAQQRALQAQQAVNQARVDARRSLEDLANNLTDAQLGERRATQALAEAQANLDAVAKDPRASAAQKSAAQLAFDEAKQALAEQQLQVRRLSADKATADKAGVKGSQQVLAAEQQLTEARQTAADRQRALAKARGDATAVEQQNAERARQAQEGLTRAQLALASAQAQATAGTSKLDKAMAALTPTERAAMGQFHAFGAAYRSWVTALEPSVFPAITGGLDLIQSLFKPLTPIVKAASGAFAGLEKDAGKALQSPFWKNALDTLAKLTGPAITTFGHVVGNILTGLAGIGVALAPHAGGVLAGIEHLSERFANFGKHASEPGGFQTFLAWVRDNLPRAIDWFKEVGRAVFRLGEALAPIGGYVLGGIKLLAEIINHLPPDLIGAIVTGFLGMSTATKAMTLASEAFKSVGIVSLILGLAAAFVYAYQHSQTFRNIVKAVLGEVVKIAEGAGKLFAKYIVDPIKAVPNAISDVWDGVKRVFTSGVNGVIGFINDLIGGIDWVLRKLHIPEIPRIPLIGQKKPAAAGGGGGGHANRTFAYGGVLPGYAPGVDSVHAMLSPGEAVLVPEAVRALGPATILGWNAHFSRGRAAGPSAAGGFAGGGLVDAVIDTFSRIKDLAGEIIRHGAASLVNRATSVIARAAGVFPGLVGDMGSGTIRFLGGQLADWINGQQAKFVFSPQAQGNAAMSPGPQVSRWAPVAAQALALLGQQQALVSPVLQLIRFESGGNPTAVNRSDINWQRGTPSVGLAQVIGPTFRGNAGPYAKTGPFLYGVSVNPLANVYAGLHYGIARYGSIGNIPGIKSALAGGPYLPYDQGGYLPPGVSTVINGTGRPEPVFTDAQWRTLAANRSPVRVQGTLTGTMDLGNGVTAIVRGELDAWERGAARQITDGRRPIPH